MPKKKVEVPVDTFKVFLRFPKEATHKYVATIVKDVKLHENSKVLFLPNDIEVLVVNDKGQTRVL